MRNAAFILVLILAPLARAQTTATVVDADPLGAINALRTDLVDSFNKQDLPRLLSHLDPDAVVTWQNGEVCHGPAEVKAYYDKMMTGPDHVVASATADPQVTSRHVFGDWAVSSGVMNDHFKLNDGHELALNSKFTATIARRGAEWKVVAFHVSVNAFDNPILGTAVKQTAVWTGVTVGIVSLVVGLAIGLFISKRRTKSA